MQQIHFTEHIPMHNSPKTNRMLMSPLTLTATPIMTKDNMDVVGKMLCKNAFIIQNKAVSYRARNILGTNTTPNSPDL